MTRLENGLTINQQVYHMSRLPWRKLDRYMQVVRAQYGLTQDPTVHARLQDRENLCIAARLRKFDRESRHV